MVFRRLVTYGEEDVYGEAPEDVSGWVGGVTSFNGGVELVGEKVAVLTGGPWDIDSGPWRRRLAQHILLPADSTVPQIRLR